jgi:uncharacterized protein (DUF58 family)
LAIYNDRELQLYGHLELLARQAVEGFITGLHKSPFHGFSVEFSEHRQYNPGESTKFIDWKLYGRTDKLFVKRFEEETNLRCQILIDNSSSMYFPFDESRQFVSRCKTNYALFASAVILYLLKLQRDAFGLTVFSDKTEFHTNARSTTQHHRHILNHLEELAKSASPDVRKTTSVVKTLHDIADRIHRRSLVVLFTDMFDGDSSVDDIIDALQHMRHNKHEVIVFHVTDKSKEIELKYANRPYKFIDMEDNSQLILNPNEIREAYEKRLRNLFEEIRSRCAASMIDVVETDIEATPESIIKPYLTKRNKMV